MAIFTPHEAPAKEISALPLMHPGRPIGRDELLKEIYTHLQKNTPVLLYGKEGVGKTAIVAALAAAYTQQAGGVLWLNGDTRPLAALLVRVGRAYNAIEITNAEQPQAMAGAVANLLMQHKPFIVLDGVQDAFVTAQFLEKCVGKLPVVMISTEEIVGNWQSIAVDKLGDMDAATLFKQKGGINNDTHEIDVYGIAKLCKYQPLPIVIASRAMVAAKQTPAQFFNVLDSVIKANAGDSVQGAIASSYRALNNALQGLILLLGATPKGEAGVELLSSAGGAPQDAIDQAMNILSQLYLVERFMRYGQPFYRLHSEVFAFAQSTLKSSNRLGALQAKIQETLLTYVKKYTSVGGVNGDKLATEMENVLATAENASDMGDKSIANQLVTLLLNVDDFVKERGYVYEVLKLRQFGSGSTTAFPAYPQDSLITEDDEYDEDVVIESVGFDDDDDYDDDEYDEEYDEDDEEEELTLFETKDYEGEDEDDSDDLDDGDSEEFVAVRFDDLNLREGMDSNALKADALTNIDVEQLRMALNQAKQHRDTTRQLQILKAIGKVQVKNAKDTEAIVTYSEALQISETANDEDSVLETLDILSALLTKTGNSSAAVMHATRALQMATERNDRETRLSVLLTLGDARQDLGETVEAEQVFSQVLEISRQTGDMQNEALALYKLGYAQLDGGDPEQAIQTWEQARELFKAQGKRDYEGRVLGNLAVAYGELDRWSEAIRYHQTALHIAREVRDVDEEALQLNNLAQAQLNANKLPDALLSYRQALYLAYVSGVKEDIVAGIVDLVRLMMRSNKLLGVCQLLLQDAENYDPNDRDVIALSQSVTDKLSQVGAQGIVQTPVTGSARDYAENAYSLL